MKKIKIFFLLCLLGMISIAASAADIPNNEIWYEASSKLTETTGGYYSDGLHTNAFNTTIISHTFSNGKGIIRFNAKVTSIGESAFFDCSSLTSVTIPNSVTQIGDDAFYHCYSLTSVTIPNSVTSIGVGAFSDCYGLTSVTIPNSVTSIGGGAFTYCLGLTSVTIPNSVTEIADGVFRYCEGLTSVTIPNSVTSIGNHTFQSCRGLTSVTIPNSVTSIGVGAFNVCNSLTNITVESGNKVYDSRSNCNAIIETATNTLINGCMNTIIPNSVTSIGYEAFYGCSGLTSVTIPNSVTSIGRFAFAYCSSLTSLTIPNSVTSIGNEAFEGCLGLTSVEINIVDWANKNVAATTSYLSRNSFSYTYNGIKIEGDYTIPNSLTTIGDYALYCCKDITKLTIPNSVTSIGNSAFSRCSGLTSVYVEWNNADRIPVLTSSWDFPYSTCDLYVPTGTKAIYQEKDYWNSFKNIYEYEFESVLLGDANDDGSVDVSDITSIATYILNGKATTWNEKNADVNGDGVIDVSDITGVASIILGIKDLSYLTCPDDHHPHAIDLGLPSGTKWCCCNVGATTPEGYGDYYAWGETSEKSVYNEVTYKYCNGEDTDGDGWYDRNWKYQNIGSDIAGTQYDVAHVRMGGSWRMPSHEQQMELKNNCTQTWIQQNGVNGILVTGKNGGQVFLPAAGGGWNDGLIDVGSNGVYWSSSLKSSSGKYACFLFFDFGNWGWSSYYYRGNGLSVRAVCP